MTNQYNYDPIHRSTREIRLLELLPQDGNSKLENIPSCNIFHTSLDKNPKFIALSYVWGDAKDLRVIRVKDCTVKVTKNLYEAMMTLRSLKEPLVIWIDALCINQSDEVEKSWQVGLMADIYRSAHKVTAWIGPADSDSDLVIDYLNSLGAKAEEVGFEFGHDIHKEAWSKLPSKRSAVNSKGQSMAQSVMLENIFYSISGFDSQRNLLPTAGMKRLFTRPWWGRVWVLQEITLPKNAELLCGAKKITRRRCSAALNAYLCLWLVLKIKYGNEPDSLTVYQREILMVLFHIRANLMLSSRRIYQHERFPLAALLRATCVGTINPRRHGPHNLESTDPRDKIFALIGLAADREELESLGLLPDYSKTTKEIYSMTMAALIKQGHISLLSHCQHRRKLSELPSWVPDWSGSITDMLQDVENDHVTLDPRFNATGSALREIDLNVLKKDGAIDAISINGIIYDKIYAVGSFPDRVFSHEVPLSETYSWPVKWLSEILCLTNHGKNHYKDFRARLLAAARTSIGGTGFGQDAEPARVGDDRFVDAFVLLRKNIQKIEQGWIKDGIRQLWESRNFRNMVKCRTISSTRLGSEIIGKSLGRVPSITKKGHLVLGFEDVKRGDVVALISGSQVPFILRRQDGGRYRIMGEAYVDGIMDGEASVNASFGRIELV